MGVKNNSVRIGPDQWLVFTKDNPPKILPGETDMSNYLKPGIYLYDFLYGGWYTTRLIIEKYNEFAWFELEEEDIPVEYRIEKLLYV